MIIAPLLHNAACKMQNNVTSEKSQYKVKALIFLVTSAFSLWAILGGAITIMLLLEAPVRVENSGLFMLVLLVVWAWLSGKIPTPLMFSFLRALWSLKEISFPFWFPGVIIRAWESKSN